MEIVMDAQVQSRIAQPEHYLPFEVVALVLQGGGALGAYQAGVYEALSEAGIYPPAYRSAPSTPPSSQAMRRMTESIGCANFGRK